MFSIVQDADLDLPKADDLPSVYPHFFIPKLSDSPQDPIMDTLKLPRRIQGLHGLSSTPVLPTELLALADLCLLPALKDEPHALWERAATKRLGSQNHIKSWDALRSSYPKHSAPSPFLSEQPKSTLAAARYHIDPRLRDPGVQIIHVGLAELLSSMRMVIIGNSSSIYTWDSLRETFVLAHAAEGKRGMIILDGRDDILTESFLRRFLTIGSVLRRIEMFTTGLRTKYVKEGPTAHSFAHALASCVDHLRRALVSLPTYSDTVDWLQTPSAMWLQHAEYEEVVSALGSLCGRAVDIDPPHYPQFSPEPTALLTAIYKHMELCLERQSSPMVTGMLAYVLTVSSDEYYQALGLSVGYSQDLISATMDKLSSEPHTVDMFDDGGVQEDIAYEEAEDEQFPSFITPDAAETLVRARRSLKLLRTAQPDHPLLHQVRSQQKISWFWTPAEVECAWQAGPADANALPASALSRTPQSLTGEDKMLQQFKLFDLEPDTLSNPITSLHGHDSTLQRILTTFPDSLPALTPTLSHLANLVLSPLVDHCLAVSNSLLSVILTPSSHINIHSHLTLLRDYMLLTSPSFTSRLQTALFSNSDDWNFEGSSARALAKRSQSRTRAASGSGAPWAVGLGLGLSERDSWPPGGADLSYYLRTVIVDSLDSSSPSTVTDSSVSSHRGDHPLIFEEAEFRLGFAIRDLPVGSGRERWLNPCSIEALDFLLIDYKPPRPLDVVITQDTLSKYQRVFSFILRLMRVQNALGAFFRMTRRSSEPLFATMSPFNQLLLHFRFIAHSFVELLSEYVFDTAIRGNFDTFLEHLEPGSSARKFTDVFALSDLHSSMLDDVLSACLLRSGQRVAGDLLRGSLELALDVCILSGELKRGRLEEYKAAPVLQDLYTAFRSKMAALVKVLRALVDKESTGSHLPMEFAHLATTGRRAAPGGSGSLQYLLVKLDSRDWWTKLPMAG
ncbi:hypothetical protein FA95DRAFT_508656 [Auriscalpium vulgare]|uniref:Uncharacterized protein n=1 Tax=Auriscalpium vulgare TaxID=40419 RepID=A0ACB8RFC4_9AGAM|nr:hypothetical protein FA95DRAFT_508656 [Auriscalpium vulgare]